MTALALDTIFRPDRPASDDLQRAYRAARARGDRAEGHRLYNEWFRARCSEGRPPDALSRESADPVERFWACVVEGPDGHWFWDGPREGGKPLTRSFTGYRQSAIRFSWILVHGAISPTSDVWSTCGEEHCLRPEHLENGRSPARHAQYYRETALIGAIQACAMKLGQAPLRREYEAWRPRRGRGHGGVPTDVVLVRRFGSWDDAVRAAGLEPRGVTGRYESVYDEETVIAGLADLTAELGRTPTELDWNEAGRTPSGTTIRRHNGGWPNALAKAGIQRTPSTHCSKGHEKIPENRYLRNDGYTECALCRREQRRDRRRAA